MRLIVLSSFVLFAMNIAAREKEPSASFDLETLHKLIVPAAEEIAWQNIPWMVDSLWQALDKKERRPRNVAPPPRGPEDARFAHRLAKGGVVVRVHAREFDRDSDGKVRKAPPRGRFHNLGSLDHLWLRPNEWRRLLPPEGADRGKTYTIDDEIAFRIARYHLVDNTRGEPPFWRRDEARRVSMTLTVTDVTRERVRLALKGDVHLETRKGDRGFKAELQGTLEFEYTRHAWTRFDLVAIGDHWCEGRNTRRARPGKSLLGIAFVLADGSTATDQVPPQTARDLRGYFRAAPRATEDALDSGARPIVATFSIVAVDPKTGTVGAAVASKYPAVGKVVPYVRAGVGGFCTQHEHVPAWGERALDLLAAGKPPERVIADLLANDKRREQRQLAIVDMQGRAAIHNPTAAPQRSEYWAAMTGKYYACQGNTLAGREVVLKMAAAYEDTKGSVADRLMAALVAADCVGGDHRGRLAAGIRLAHKGVEGYWLELHVDKSDEAVIDLLKKYVQLEHAAKGEWARGRPPFQHPCADRKR